MNCPRIQNVNIDSMVLLATPHEMQDVVPQTPKSMETVVKGRETIERMLDGEDNRMLALIGPCSIHNLDGASEYAPPCRSGKISVFRPGLLFS